jgi:hypothetical protein
MTNAERTTPAKPPASYLNETPRSPPEYHIDKRHQQRRTSYDDNRLPYRRANERKVTMVEIHKRDGMSDEARLAKRLRPSNDQQTADTFVTHGSSPTRTHTSIHRSGTNLHHDNPHSRSILRGDRDTDMADVINRPKAGPPNFGSFKGGK